MIRINLLRNMGVSGAGTSMGTSAAGGSSEIISVDVRRQAAVKVVVILLFPIVLFIWETLRLNTLQAEQVQLKQRVDGVEAERASFGSAGPRVDKANKLKDKMQREIKIIRELAKNRLREVKTLDQLQTILPEGVWLSQIQISNGKVTLDGYALTVEAINTFSNSLDSNVYFSRSRLMGQTQVENSLLGPVQKFSVEFEVGQKGES